MMRVPADKERTVLDYSAGPSTPRIWGVSRPIWLFAFGFFVFIEFAFVFAAARPISGVGDRIVGVVPAVLAMIALINADRLMSRT